MSQPADPWERPLPTEPTPSAPDQTMDAPVARRTAMEMAALTRVLFGVTVPRQASTELGPPPSEAPVRSPEPSIPVVDIPVPHESPAPRPTAGSAPASVAPASLPLPEIPVVAPAPGSAENTSEPAQETQRRPVGPSPELLQEIAFLEE